MILRSSPASPFARKVIIAAHHLALLDRLQILPADTRDPGDSLRSQNPLGKIPVLVLDDGRALYDSRVILDYLDDLAGGGRIIPRGPERFDALTRQAAADGVMDAALLQIYEHRFRGAERRDADWLAYQAEKVARGLEFFQAAGDRPSDRVDVGDIAQACMLGYLDFRFDGTWRKEHAGLVGWLDRFAHSVPGFAATAPG